MDDRSISTDGHIDLAWLPYTLLRAALGIGMATVSGHAASAESGAGFPNKPIRVVATGVGSASDLAARLIAPTLADNVGQSVIVDNRIGGLVIAEIVAKAPPDGYTVLLSGSSLWLWPLMQDQPSYDPPVRDFSPITMVTTSPLIVVVHPSVQARTIQ
jgi:tripartite-type tricarboxylate transporter receptor subunit TctC